MNITTLIFMIFLMAGLLIYYLIPSRSDLLSDTQPFSMAVPAGAVLRFPLGG